MIGSVLYPWVNGDPLNPGFRVRIPVQLTQGYKTDLIMICKNSAHRQPSASRRPAGELTLTPPPQPSPLSVADGSTPLPPPPYDGSITTRLDAREAHDFVNRHHRLFAVPVQRGGGVLC